MTSRPTDIVVTTIHAPAWLPGYLDNLRAHGHARDTTLRIIGDRKTPASVWEAARRANADGFRIDCPTLDEQQAYLKKLGAPDALVPWDTDNRRNIGFLRAWESGAQVLISIDDDNYCRTDSDFIGAHRCVGQPAHAHAQQSAGGAPLYNLCERLEAPAGPFFPRGFPYAARKAGTRLAAPGPLGADGARRVAVNAGLWLEDPDVDALTRITLQPRAVGVRPGALVLAPETWSPINTQNTAVVRDAIPAYYYARMGYALQGLSIDRFGDILSGYFVQACVKALGDTVRIGDPVADHRRTPHDLFKDLHHEIAGIVLVEELLPWLQSLKLGGSGYGEAYAALAEALARQADGFRGFVWDQGGREFVTDTAACMQAWLRLIRQLG